MTESALVLSDSAVETLRQVAAKVLTRGVVLVCGFPASGKTTAAAHLADWLNAVTFDKDSFAPGLEEAVMAELTGNPFDRDSATYRRVVGPNVYDALTRNALRVGHQCPVVLDAPFLEYVVKATERGVSLSDYLRAMSPTPVSVTTIWIATDPDTIRQRMISRGAERDRPKLDDWDTYRSTVLDSPVGRDAKDAVDVYLVN